MIWKRGKFDVEIIGQNKTANGKAWAGAGQACTKGMMAQVDFAVWEKIRAGEWQYIPTAWCTSL